ncbi:MAG TPA: hypothetical protein VM120_01145 [Bryobacteraceae bacterium]|nr:hypothetical protein [Bryobacteraceae bacterium]
MTSVAIVLLVQASLSFSPLGYLAGPEGRLYPLYGMRSNFLLGEPVDEKVLSAASFGGKMVQKLPWGIRLPGERTLPTAGGPALFAWTSSSGGMLYAWLPATREMISSTTGAVQLPFELDHVTAMAFPDARRLRILRSKRQDWEIIDLDIQGFRVMRITEVATTLAALDSLGNVWSGVDAEVACESSRWRLDEPLLAFTPLDDGWMVLQTRTAAQAARCNVSDLSAVPLP